MQKLTKPIIFDKLYEVVVLARDGEKFFVCSSDELLEYDELSEAMLAQMPLKSLLQWAVENDYPIKKFVKLQKLLMEEYFD